MEANEITRFIIGAAFEVHNTLGFGFLEKVYQNAMVVELSRNGLAVQKEVELGVYYRGEQVGRYFADLLVESRVLVELKTTLVYQSSDEAQLLNELKASRLNIGLLINFGREKVQYKRMIFSG